MKKTSLLAVVLLLSGCSFSAVEMVDQATIQKYDLSDPENDGVISARDACPDTFSGANINNNGCAQETVEKIRRELMINFDSGSAEVKSKYYSEIKDLANFLNQYPTVSVTIEGHTSIVGDARYNKKLSLQRADAIKLLLVNKYGIKNSRVKAIGYGEEKPLLKGDSEYVHAKNRRIVAEIFGEKKIKDLKWTIYSVDQGKK
ncbi:OmpA family protein [Psychromonas algicola]|uniref:OmpA family protein n=1 Tax=Psychromonas algicola TaxID=2555642 RepID=UPI001068D1CB|nr:OmpA family protein [Psychromonas sp. RZ5]TEW44844.1 OmpA family protein [Psychromonas sp. RZ5]